MRYRLSNTAAKFGVLIFPNGYENAGRVIKSFWPAQPVDGCGWQHQNCHFLSLSLVHLWYCGDPTLVSLILLILVKSLRRVHSMFIRSPI